MWRSSTEQDENGRPHRRPHRAPDYVIVGRVTRPHGVRGEVRVRPVDTAPERFLEFPWVYGTPKSGDGGRRQLQVRRARIDRGDVVIAFEGMDSRDAAEAWRDARIEIPGEWVKPLPPGHYYVFELVGCRVETVSGSHVGLLVDVLSTGANDVYVVKHPSGEEVLIPAIREMVKEVDVVQQRIIVDPWPGLLPEEDGSEGDDGAR